MAQYKRRLRMRLGGLFLASLFLPIWLSLGWAAPAPAQTEGSLCAAITQPLTPEEQAYAQSAWNYFKNNVQADTGLSNAAGNYPSSTLWDLGNYLTALNAARWLGLIDQPEFDGRLNKFLNTLSHLPLFENTLPNKAYSSATGEMTNYNNAPTDRGIGWSALDLGRMLAALNVVRTCHPQYSDWLSGIVSTWNVVASVKDGQLYGATVLPDGTTLKVQEGRLGYEEYAARGYYAWGFEVPQALAYEPFKFVDIYGLQIPVDERDYQTTQASNYVVSESYILDGIEYGLQGGLAEFGRRVFEAQKRRYEDTGLLTAVSEDNLNGPPHFLYSTVYANGVPWAAITDTNELHPELRTLSTKAAFGWRYLYPEDAYAQQVFAAVKDRTNSGQGYYAGLFENSLSSSEPTVNDILTGNTNGLILEILYYKARGSQPLLAGGKFAAPASSATEVPSTATSQPAIAIPPIAPVGPPQSSVCPRPSQSLSPADAQSARQAWQYFETHSAATGLVPDRNDLPGATLWGTGDYLAALNSARSLEILDSSQFDGRVRHLLGALKQMPLFAGELPNRAYSTLTLEPITYGGNANPSGNGWSGLDVGRLLAALYQLKTCHPEYTEAVDQTVLDWSFLRVIRNGQVTKANFTEQGGRDRIQIDPATQLGYEEYAARAFQLWGFDASQSAPSNRYVTTELEGQAIPVRREGAQSASEPLKATSLNTTSTPFVLYGLEFGLEPEVRSLLQPMLQAEANRYQRTGSLSASGTALINQAPYVVHSPLVVNGKAWQAVTDDGSPAPQGRIVSTAVALAYEALFPNTAYAQTVAQATRDRFDSTQGYYEGIYEADSRSALGFTSSTNSLILQAILYRNTGAAPLVQPNANRDSPWWQAIRSGSASRQGLPTTVSSQIDLVASATGAYWGSNNSTSTATAPSTPIPATSHPISPASPSAQATVSSQSMPTAASLQALSPEDQTAARWAWAYFENNWNSTTGLVNGMDNIAWSTLWDQGSALLGIHAGHQLGLLPDDQFHKRIDCLLQTLATLPLPTTGLPNKAYSTATAEMRTLNNRPDRQGSSGWSALDMGRYLLSLHTLKIHYPEYADRIDAIVARYDLKKLVKDGWLWGSGAGDNGLQHWQEGRLGYEQYAAHSLKLWGIEADKALHSPPVQTVNVDGVSLQTDKRDRNSSGASNPLTNDPYILWGLELGWPDSELTQVNNLLQVQANRYAKTGILTAVNEDALDRQPYFLYYSVYADGQPWAAVNTRGQNYARLRFLSTKAAFAWAALFPDQAYPQQLRQNVQTLADEERGYLSGRYENSDLGPNRALNVNTNAIVLESLLYKTRGQKPLAL